MAQATCPGGRRSQSTARTSPAATVSSAPPDGLYADRERVDHLRHKVNNPLRIVRGHAGLKRRRRERPGVLTEQTLPMMLAHLAAIDAALMRVVMAMDAFAQAGGTPGASPPETSDTRDP